MRRRDVDGDSTRHVTRRLATQPFSHENETSGDHLNLDCEKGRVKNDDVYSLVGDSDVDNKRTHAKQQACHKIFLLLVCKVQTG